MLVETVMTSPAITVAPWTPIEVARSLLEEYAVGALPVIDDDGRLVGMLRVEQIRRPAIPLQRGSAEAAAGGGGGTEGSAGRVRVEALMERFPSWVGPDYHVLEARHLMAQSSLGSLPVIRDGAVIGVISLHDVLGVIAEDDTDDAEELRARARLLGQARARELVTRRHLTSA